MYQRRYFICGLLAILAIAPVRLGSQTVSSEPQEHAVALSVNVGISGLTAGITTAVKGGSFWRGFLGGTVGGVVSYAGKNVIAADFEGSGVLGREISAIGASIVANASSGQDLLHRIILPYGFLRLHIFPFDRRLTAKVDATNLAYTVYLATQDQVDLDWGRSLMSGTAVFIDQTPASWAGRHRVGVLVLQDRQVDQELRRRLLDAVQRHEHVHLAQYDFSSIVWGEPAERWLSTYIPGGATIHKYADFRADHLLWAGLHRIGGANLLGFEAEAKLTSGN